MKVFLSWSGNQSHKVALALRDWLPSVIQTIEPYVSSEDIDKGARWSTDIAKELEDSTFGILCVTKENIEAPWLLFEAGALSKMMDKSSVCPFIFDLKRVEVKGPILQFQSTIFEEEDVKKLLLSINKACGETALKEDFLIKTFEVWWPTLEQNLKKIDTQIDTKVEGVKSEEKNDNGITNEILEELLELSRTNQKILRAPELLFPKEYLDFILNNNKSTSKNEMRIIEKQKHISMELEHRSLRIRDLVEKYKEEERLIDDEFYHEFRRFIDLMQHQSMRFREDFERIMKR
ncbi:TIR domain-containing protein [Tenacibaculum finnmarkense]|uniref:TIR domain-containing protein n=1 Tax=Tenacibaculum finnmarkense TaxID=2781243 RepID=UPI001EFB7951|nr:TIR domain-containing protein [Tenacibaculum finnmarkense]MCG8208413.1 toll/interleukin-1 receptor domain-containing protein [Tenacibaculum finnmarkense genomovar finnmarkense]MCG8724370.1 TIR domain-containing protein [Tenacibaculum finnmarkense]MCG8742685.1 TIR domain-containing protein [Tenacibaculum finnmarkense]MCG8766094.1 TIR domain-containing protein [Tenacibaculum finnmarkense]MCG8779050.1 TIR domain-containing protein [Tenacibaculum finnmarkense]